jgi:hypothetical protein
MCERDTVGTVPDAPGLYAFTVASRPGMRLGVMYLGMTTHLSMVTKGILLEVAGPEVGSATVVPPMPAPHANRSTWNRKSHLVEAERRAPGAAAAGRCRSRG